MTVKNADPSWVLSFRSDDGRLELWDLHGLGWYDAPVPRRLHRCTAQTRGWNNWFTLVERCACGSIRINRGRWTERNAREREAA